MVAKPKSQPQRFVIDFSYAEDINDVAKFKELYKIIEKDVFPSVEKNAKLEKEGKIKENGREQHSKTWWKMWRRREDMLENINKLNRYIACARVTQRPIFEFISKEIHPNDQIMIFRFDDDFSFGIIQSYLHWLWFTEKCSTLGNGYRYTANTVWDTFPWPQKPSEKQIEKVATAAKALRDERNTVMLKNNSTLRDVYRLLEKPGKNKLKDLHNYLDNAVIEAYGFDPEKDILEQLLELNLKTAQDENEGKKVQAPGLPSLIKEKKKYISNDCVKFID